MEVKTVRSLLKTCFTAVLPYRNALRTIKVKTTIDILIVIHEICKGLKKLTLLL